ncbi:MAG: hypothetical protein JWN67_3922 [Actinomycetia bacterium]|nr:hypothetical protein [Actinomycetes bacterium]
MGVRKALLVGTVVLLGGCTYSSPPRAAAEKPRVDSVVRRPDVDLGTADRRAGRMLVGVGATGVDVGFDFNQTDHPGPALLEFTALGVEADCLAKATLGIEVSPARVTPVPLAVYPVRPDAWPDGEQDGTPVGRQLLLDRRPRAIFHRVGRGMQADVTELVRTWLRGGPFPSRGATVELGTPLRLAIQPEAGSSSKTYRVAMSEQEGGAPTLTLQPCAAPSVDAGGG